MAVLLTDGYISLCRKGRFSVPFRGFLRASPPLAACRYFGSALRLFLSDPALPGIATRSFGWNFGPKMTEKRAFLAAAVGRMNKSCAFCDL